MSMREEGVELERRSASALHEPSDTEITIEYNHSASSNLLSRLPDELLQMVLLEYSRPTNDRANGGAAGKKRHSCHWILVTHVCRRWRDVAMQYSPLWSDICIPGNLDYIAAFLARSGTAPLSVHVEQNTEEPNSLLRQILLVCQHFHRIQLLDLRVTPGIYAQVSKELGPAIPAPQLKSLFLFVYDIALPDLPAAPLAASNPHVPPLVTLVEAPNLSLLMLSPQKGIIHKLPTFPLLKTLFFFPDLAVIDPEETVTLDEILSGLRGLPLLERFSFPCLGMAQRMQPAPRARLPNLKAISLAGDALQCSYFLRHIEFPATAQLQVTGASARGDIDITTIRSLVASLAGEGRTGPRVPLRYLSIECDKMRTFVCGSPTLLLTDKTGDPSFSIDLPPGADWDGAICDLLPLHEVVELDLTQNPDCDRKISVAGIIARMQNVEEMRVFGQIGEDVARCFHADSGSTRDAYPFSKLRRLHLHAQPLYARRRVTLPGGTGYTSLVSALQRRKEQGHQLGTLVIDKACARAMKEETLEQLREVVGMVEISAVPDNPWDVVSIPSSFN